MVCPSPTPYVCCALQPHLARPAFADDSRTATLDQECCIRTHLAFPLLLSSVCSFLSANSLRCSHNYTAVSQCPWRTKSRGPATPKSLLSHPSSPDRVLLYSLDYPGTCFVVQAGPNLPTSLPRVLGFKVCFTVPGPPSKFLGLFQVMISLPYATTTWSGNYRKP